MSCSTAAIADLVRPLPSGTTVVAVTDDGTEPRYAPVRELAARVARLAGGTLLLCVAPARDAAPPRARPRLFVPPVGDEAGRQHTGTRSHDLLLAEARQVSAPGLAIGVWLPSRHGLAGVVEAVVASGATLVLVPARAQRAAVLDRTLEYMAARVEAPVVAVEADGSWSAVRALGGSRDAGRPTAVAGPHGAPLPAV